MSIGIIPSALTIPNDQPWVEDVRFWLDSAKTQPATVSSASAFLKSKSTSQTIVFPMTVANGRLVVAGGIVGIRVPLADIATIPPDNYTLEVKATDSSNYTRQVRGDVIVVPGLGS